VVGGAQISDEAMALYDFACAGCKRILAFRLIVSGVQDTF
ncbi:unnamed protein product, partial [Acidithrix sp. C25]